MALETKTPFPSTNPFVSRALSAFELLFGAFVVIGHNVFHIVPDEVIVLCVLGLVSSATAKWRMVCNRVYPTGVLAPNFPNRIGGGRCAHPPWAIRDRTAYRIFLASAYSARVSE